MGYGLLKRWNTLFKLNLFINALKLKQGISYQPTDEDRTLADTIPMHSWMQLIYQYTLSPCDIYNIKDMLTKYIKGELEITSRLNLIKEKYGDVWILGADTINRKARAAFIMRSAEKDTPDNIFLKVALTDNMVYEALSLWYLTYNKELMTRVVIFTIGKEACKYVAEACRSINDIYPLVAFAKWFSETQGYTHIYYTFPKSMPGFISTDEISKIDLGEHYKYDFTKEWLESHSLEEIKKLCYGN